MADNVELHPIVAELAAAMQRSPDNKQVAFPPEAVEKARLKVRASTDPELLAHLLAVAVKIKRVAGDGGTPAIAALAALVAEKIGSAEDAADRFAAAGIANAAQLLGVVEKSRAPRAEPKPPPTTIKPKRGLR